MIFLSASIPDQSQDAKYLDSADIVAIRDAVKALATVVIPKSKLVWGGHPAITPLIRYVMSNMGIKVQDHVMLYQSRFFQSVFPEDNEYFEQKVLTEARESPNESIRIMREQIFSNHNFQAGVFIGGMKGVEDEYELFKERHPHAEVFPIASTGAAAEIIYKREAFEDERLKNEYAYMALFRTLFQNIIKL